MKAQIVKQNLKGEAKPGNLLSLWQIKKRFHLAKCQNALSKNSDIPRLLRIFSIPRQDFNFLFAFIGCL